MDRPGDDGLDQPGDVDIVPDLIPLRPVRQRDPAQIVGQRHADAEQPRLIEQALVAHRLHLQPEERQHLVGHGKGDLARGSAADIAHQIHHRDRDVVTIDVEADREASVGVDRKTDRRLTTQSHPTTDIRDQPEVQ